MDNDNRKLYPMRFLTDKEETPWGRVSYHVADLGFKDSMVENGWFGGNALSELLGTYLERVVGDDNFEYYGLQFPLLLKVLEVSRLQPLQVNVPDLAASERYDAYGKKALWYIKEASPGARLFIGFNRDLTAGDFYARCLEGRVEEVLNSVSPKKGEAFLIEPGTVFAAGPGLEIVEVSECSELTFNLHYWGDDVPENGTDGLEEAFDLIDFRRYSKAQVGGQSDFESGLPASAPGASVLASCPELVVTRIPLRDPLRIKSEEPGSFALYHCLSGEMTVQYRAEGETGAGTAEHLEVAAGRSVLVPSEVNDFLLAPLSEGTVLLEAYVERHWLDNSKRQFHA